MTERTDADDRKGLLAATRRLLLEERASAVAELVVLIPVYIVMLTGLIYLGEGTVARQEGIEATRFMAWQGHGDIGGDGLFGGGGGGIFGGGGGILGGGGVFSESEMEERFFDRFSGSLEIANVRRSEFRHSQGDVRDALSGTGSRADEAEVARFLNNDGESLIVESTGRVRFVYRSAFFDLAGLDSPDLPIDWVHYVLLPSGTRRDVFRSHDEEHPIEEFTDTEFGTYQEEWDAWDSDVPMTQRGFRPDIKNRPARSITSDWIDEYQRGLGLLDIP